jgi:hypothetical protein
MSQRLGPIAAMVATLVVAVPVLASHVVPEFTRDAESCGTLSPGTVEFLVDASQLGPGIPSNRDFRVDVQLSGSLDGGSVSFSGATLPIEAAFVAGIDGGNLYDYPEPVTADDGLVAPNGQPIVKVSFCYVVGGTTGAGAGPTDQAGESVPPTDTVAPGRVAASPPTPLVVAVLIVLAAGVAVATVARIQRRD